MSDFIERFEAFARSKPADEKYEFLDICECPVGQFGYHNDLIRRGEPFAASEELFGLHVRLDPALRSKPWTFGALADRLSALRGRGL